MDDRPVCPLCMLSHNSILFWIFLGCIEDSETCTNDCCAMCWPFACVCVCVCLSVSRWMTRSWRWTGRVWWVSHRASLPPSSGTHQEWSGETHTHFMIPNLLETQRFGSWDEVTWTWMQVKEMLMWNMIQNSFQKDFNFFLNCRHTYNLYVFTRWWGSLDYCEIIEPKVCQAAISPKNQTPSDTHWICRNVLWISDVHA